MLKIHKVGPAYHPLSTSSFFNTIAPWPGADLALARDLAARAELAHAGHGAELAGATRAMAGAELTLAVVVLAHAGSAGTKLAGYTCLLFRAHGNI